MSSQIRQRPAHFLPSPPSSVNSLLLPPRRRLSLSPEMEFLDEEARPRLLFQSRPQPTATPENHTVDYRKPSFIISITVSILLFALSILFIPFEPFQSISLWIALSLLLGSFCPSSLTGGDVRVGVGKLLHPPHHTDDSDLDDPKKKNRRSKMSKHDEPEFAPVALVSDFKKNNSNSEPKARCGVEEEWNEGDFDLLKKLLVKNPVGKPKRWEVIAEGFQGRHGVESVIKMAKSMGERKLNDSDSFARFLKDRKSDKRIESANEDGEGRGEKGGCGEWSSGEDIALLNALKAFPKEAPMRWEKIAAAVPGKTKAACMKRVTDLKKGFRSSKASADH